MPFVVDGLGDWGKPGRDGPSNVVGNLGPQGASKTPERAAPPITFRGLVDVNFVSDRLSDAEDDYAADGDANLAAAALLLKFVQILGGDNDS